MWDCPPKCGRSRGRHWQPQPSWLQLQLVLPWLCHLRWCWLGCLERLLQSSGRFHERFRVLRLLLKAR